MGKISTQIEANKPKECCKVVIYFQHPKYSPTVFSFLPTHRRSCEQYGCGDENEEGGDDGDGLDANSCTHPEEDEGER